MTHIRVVKVGVDLVEVQRVGQAIARHGDRFLQRVYTPAELAYCAGRLTSLAARFAAKEAVAKALGTGIAGFTWRDIETTPDANGCPTVRLVGGAAARAAVLGVTACQISLSHTANYAVASVVAIGEARD